MYSKIMHCGRPRTVRWILMIHSKLTCFKHGHAFANALARYALSSIVLYLNDLFYSTGYVPGRSTLSEFYDAIVTSSSIISCGGESFWIMCVFHRLIECAFFAPKEEISQHAEDEGGDSDIEILNDGEKHIRIRTSLLEVYHIR